MDSLGLNHFDGIIYINLAHREDRKKRILMQLNKLKTDPKKIHRLVGIYDALNGHKGCALSHLSAIKLAKENAWQNVLILEDDCVFEHPLSKIDQYIRVFFDNVNIWHVFFLSTRVFSSEQTNHPDITRVLCSQTAHAYAVHNSYYDSLIACYQDAYDQMKDDVFFIQSLDYCIDQNWKKLQPKDLWFIGKDPIARQGRSFSDIELTIKDKPY